MFWIIFQKAGKPGWATLIPIYNTIVLLEIIKKPIWWIFMFLIPIVNIVYMVIVIIELAKKFGKESGFAIGLIFFPTIFLGILALGNSKYIGNESEIAQ